MDNLNKYNEKRNFNKTDEPKGKKEDKVSKLRFVVQHHFARRDHYDFRLELDGVMLSWAIPKGPSYNLKDKRLAVQVEDHPLSYRNFEGIIPKGEYGGGTVMVWDKGYYEPLENPKTTYKKGYLKFKLYGARLKGIWTLIKFQDNNWLLIKEKDNIKGYDSISNYNTSIKTGRTMEEIAKGIKKYNKNPLKNIRITNPDKIIYTNPKITKIEVIKYYEKVADRMLPYIENRTLSTVRCPDGIKGERFFKKHFKENPYLKEKNNNYYIDNVEGLLYEAQMNSIEFHINSANIKDLNNPNILIFDLDPDEKLSLERVRDGVRDLKSILDNLKLKSYLKTSGNKGYHIFVPLNTKVTWKELKKIARNIAKLMVTKWPDKYTDNMRMENRKGKIFIDYLRNGEGASCVAPYSLRTKKHDSISMPIKWSELDKVKPDEIKIKDAVKRLKRKDPWAGFFSNLI